MFAHSRVFIQVLRRKYKYDTREKYFLHSIFYTRNFLFHIRTIRPDIEGIGAHHSTLINVDLDEHYVIRAEREKKKSATVHGRGL